VTVRIAAWVIAGCMAALAVPQAWSAALELTAAEIIEKNAAARGGVEAWRNIDTMAWAGRVSTIGGPTQSMPFVLEQKRPNRTRFVLLMQNQKSVRVFDGSNGWKLRPAEGGKPDLQPYTEDELKFARDSRSIDGPLMEDVANGGTFIRGDVESVAGRKAYTLTVKLPSGTTHRIWVDAQTFLESRFDREFLTAAGKTAIASVLYRDYRAFEGLQLPTTIETAAGNDKPANKIVIEKVVLNPLMDERAFTKPGPPPPRHHGVAVDARGSTPAARP
jgi:outer membrane lipoprotein-sorting protein